MDVLVQEGSPALGELSPEESAGADGTIVVPFEVTISVTVMNVVLFDLCCVLDGLAGTVMVSVVVMYTVSRPDEVTLSWSSWRG